MDALKRLIRAGRPEGASALLEGWQETPVWSALEGAMGSIWSISHSPRAVLCEAGDFLFLAGDAQDGETRSLLEAWLQERSGYRILVPRDERCGAMIEDVFAGKATRGQRWAFHKDGEAFDPAALRAMADAVPMDISIVPFDRLVCQLALQQDWSRDFVSQFRDADDYLQRGLGFAALHAGELVGGASSYTVYSGGLEIQVETRSDWQRRGIASACCAALILECMKRGLYPSWDAASPASAALAQKLGYRPSGVYPVWEIRI